MTDVQKVLKDLKEHGTSKVVIECWRTDEINGYYKLYLTNGSYSYVTPKNFERIKPFIIYKKKQEINSIKTFYESIKLAFENYYQDVGIGE